jgi:hypothetical protein
MLLIILILTLFNFVILLKNLKINESIKSSEQLVNSKLDYLMSIKNNTAHKCKCHTTDNSACRC